ncbi:prenyltransferase [Salinarchaeum sp. Harcht-Bsk1]|uniref:prenyltransferase n=1 Tax=Salinarchaeum sp. Harcht-Bsk1 TaxID=1333523 RepID=UPI00034230F1|nr:prenyltransferase [Salinarchaeum sp. Harcht-Bsk1]AGN00901.1 prenyltransferase [Salinarchaeum sp. Harcht-Bsk1]
MSEEHSEREGDSTETAAVRSDPERPDASQSSLSDVAVYLFALSRPRFWLYLAGPVLVGVVYAADARADLLTPATLALFAYFLVPANVYLYGVNDVFDADVDAENPKKDEREVRYRGQRFVPVAVAASGLGLFGVVSLTDPIAWPWLAAWGLLATAYSAPPVRFKTRPVLDSLSNGLYVLPGAAAYATVAGAQPPVWPLTGGILWTMAMHTFSAIPDVEPDREAGIATTATWLGERRTLAYCFTTWALAAAAFGMADLRAGAALSLYPLLVLGIAWSDVPVDRAYWWYPAINGVVGAGLTMWGLAQIVPPSSLV